MTVLWIILFIVLIIAELCMSVHSVFWFACAALVSAAASLIFPDNVIFQLAVFLLFTFFLYNGRPLRIIKLFSRKKPNADETEDTGGEAEVSRETETVQEAELMQETEIPPETKTLN